MLVIHQFLVTAFDESPLKSNIRGCFFDRFTKTKLSVVWPICHLIGFYFLQCIPQQCSPPTMAAQEKLCSLHSLLLVPWTHWCTYSVKKVVLARSPESKLASRTILNLDYPPQSYFAVDGKATTNWKAMGLNVKAIFVNTWGGRQEQSKLFFFSFLKSRNREQNRSHVQQDPTNVIS